MKTNLTLKEIKLLSRNQFIQLLKSDGFKVKIIEGDDNYLSASDISNNQLKSICKTYGTLGWYDAKSKSATIGM